MKNKAYGVKLFESNFKNISHYNLYLLKIVWYICLRKNAIIKAKY